MIRKLHLSDGSEIKDQKKILLEVQKFYSQLFKAKDKDVYDTRSFEYINFQSLKKISNPNLGNPITVEELGNVLKKFKNNKSPGIDGISSEFLKVFWKKLKVLVANAINMCYSKGELSISLRKSVITCLPKENKDRKLIKNWRPISLLCVIYKLASAAISERLKPLLDILISQSQSGFIQGRRIGESTRLMYDLMYYTEEKRIPGLLMLIDFEKAFDSVSWKFLYKVLESFGFDEKFIKWIKLFNNNINAHILQCGFLSSAIPIERGCRQGDPIAPYLFLLVAEILSLLIEKNPDIKGIQVGKQMIKVTQFADDTTLLLDGSSSSLQATLNVLEIFGSLSGLKVNSEKTKLVWIGSKKHSKEKLYSTAKLQWIDSEFSILGIDFSTELLDIPRINYNKGLAKANKIINSWNYRHLTPIGKITVIKTLILSNFTHLFMSIPTSNIVMRDIETMLYKFLWAGKPDRVSRKDICKTNLKGGMKMINVCNFEKSLKLSWLKRLGTDSSKAWYKVLETTVRDVNKLYVLGTKWPKTVASKLNPFWNTVFKYSDELNDIRKIEKNQDIVNQCIWYNSKIGTKNIFYPDWFKRGLYFVGDVLNEKGNMLQLQEINRKYNMRVNFLNYFTIRTTLRKFILQFINGDEFLADTPNIPFHMHIYIKPLKGGRYLYHILNDCTGDPSDCEQKWCQKLNQDHDINFWKQIYKINFFTIYDNSVIWFQYRIIRRILGTQEFLHKIKQSDSDICRLCGQYCETITHLFVVCNKVNSLWKNLQTWIETKTGSAFNFSDTDKILGCAFIEHSFWPVNFILLITRFYIFKCAKDNKTLSLSQLQKLIKTKYTEQEMLSNINNGINTFDRRWSLWSDIFAEI